MVHRAVCRVLRRPPVPRLTPHTSEETIIVNRVLRDDPSKSNMHNREGLTVKRIWRIIKDWRMWPIYSLGIVFMGMCNR